MEPGMKPLWKTESHVRGIKSINDKFLVTFAEDDGTDVFLASRTKDYTAKVSQGVTVSPFWCPASFLVEKTKQ